MSSKQTLSKKVKQIFLKLDFQVKINLIIVDECHFIKQWENFQEKFAMLSQLRMLFQLNILWFECTITYSHVDEKLILWKRKFRALKTQFWKMKIICTSIDRSDVFINFYSISWRQQFTYDQLFFLLNDAVDVETKAILHLISKTNIFLDSIKKIHDAAIYFQAILWSLATNFRH